MRLDLMLTDIYINSNLVPPTNSEAAAETTKDIFPWNISWMIIKNHFNQQKNNYMLCVEKEHLLLSLKESQWELRQQFRISQWKEGHCRTNAKIRK